MASVNEIQSYYNFVLPLVKKCGKIFQETKNLNIEVENKTTYELVTKYDKKIEEILIAEIKQKYPSHRFIGEESFDQSAATTLTDDPTWIIDPIDGTTNFSRKIPFTGISVGLTINKEQVIGIVLIPFLDELYTAIKGKGAYLNEKPINCSNITDLNKSLFCYEIGVANRNDNIHRIITSRLKHLSKEVLAIRCFGCPILSLCYVASGKLDAYQGDGLQPWDAAAGTLIVREAGGYVIDSSGKEFDLMNSNFLATGTKALAEKYLNIEQIADKELLQEKC